MSFCGIPKNKPANKTLGSSYQCFKKGFGAGLHNAELDKKRFTKKSLLAMGKGALESIASKQFKIKNARKKTKADLATEIMSEQRKKPKSKPKPKDKKPKSKDKKSKKPKK